MALPVKQGLQFNGVSDYVKIANRASLQITNAITIESVFIMSEIYGYGGLWHDNYLSGANRLLVKYDGSVLAQMTIGGTTRNVLTNSSLVIKGNPTHVVYTYDGKYERIYVNGEKQIELPKTGAIAVSAADRWIGRGHDSTYYFNGKIFTTRIYNRALTAQEVAANYNGQVTRDGLVGEWLFQEGQGTTAYDTSGNGNHGTIYGATWAIKNPVSVKNARVVKTSKRVAQAKR
jgi:Concanavalin A-like lectin/glucanases superfamily